MASKNDLIAKIAENNGLTKKDVTTVVDGLLEVIGSELQAGEKVSFLGFGTFETRRREARKGRNPKTGAEIDIAASNNVGFKAGKALKDKVN
ncbi:MAG: HU family DNA-binding protein [Rickettsiales bacterium]|nr:HU family DNA-binding protein [Rickettsiales bacterium]